MAARPHGSDDASGERSVGQQEPFWRTNTSYSPPPPRWDAHFQFEGLPNGLDDPDQHYGSSASSNSKDSRRRVRSNHLYIHQDSVSDFGPEFSHATQWTPPAIQEIGIHHNSSGVSCPVAQMQSI